MRDAVAAYRNADGGFGHALESDGRTPHSQPAAVWHALRILHPAHDTLIDPADVETALARLAAGQRDDGGWTFDFPAWSAAAEVDWRGAVTVDALLILRAHGRMG